MGEAKRRGTLEQRIAQSVERQKIADAARREQFLREEEARQARLAALPPQQRREAVLMGSGHHSRLMLVAALGIAAPFRTLDSSAHGDIHHGGSK